MKKRPEDRVFFISDLHFRHKNIIGFCERPFKDVEEMEEKMIDSINSIVGANDVLYDLGDFGFGSVKTLAAIRAKIKCKNYSIVLGNHDEHSPRKYMEAGFSWASRFPIIIEKFVILSHEPMFLVPNDVRVNVHGHVHSSLPFRPSKLYFNVSAEVIDYKPISLGFVFDEVKKETK